MNFLTKIQPIQGNRVTEEPSLLQKMKLWRFFERPSTPKNICVGDQSLTASDSYDSEPSSFRLREMVQDYIEDSDNENQRCIGRNFCNCFSGSGTDSSDEEESNAVFREAEGLLICGNISTRENVLATRTTTIVGKEGENLGQEDSRLQSLVNELVALGYDASICKSKWEQSRKPLYLAGEYKYLDVMIGGERVLIDIDFKSKFEIARPTRAYASMVQMLPYVFVGKVDRLKKVVVVMSKAAEKSLKKKGLSIPPWRRANYLLIQWLAPHDRQFN